MADRFAMAVVETPTAEAPPPAAAADDPAQTEAPPAEKPADDDAADREAMDTAATPRAPWEEAMADAAVEPMPAVEPMLAVESEAEAAAPAAEAPLDEQPPLESAGAVDSPGEEEDDVCMADENLEPAAAEETAEEVAEETAEPSELKEPPELPDAPAPPLDAAEQPEQKPEDGIGEDCGKCEACLDKVKFGGPGRKRKGCYVLAKLALSKQPKTSKSTEPCVKQGPPVEVAAASSSSDGGGGGGGGGGVATSAAASRPRRASTGSTAPPKPPPPPPPPPLKPSLTPTLAGGAAAGCEEHDRRMRGVRSAPASRQMSSDFAYEVMKTSKLAAGTRVRVSAGTHLGSLGVVLGEPDSHGYYPVGLLNTTLHTDWLTLAADPSHPNLAADESSGGGGGGGGGLGPVRLRRGQLDERLGPHDWPAAAGPSAGAEGVAAEEPTEEDGECSKEGRSLRKRKASEPAAAPSPK